MSIRLTQSIQIDKEVFERLQKLATPLVDDASSLIARLIDHWELTNPDSNLAPSHSESSEFFVLSRGEKLPVGLKLRARYKKQTFNAEVTPRGIQVGELLFDNPSAAGISAKRSAGAKGSTANTNGWTFWKYYNRSTSNWLPLSDFNI